MIEFHFISELSRPFTAYVASAAQCNYNIGEYNRLIYNIKKCVKSACVCPTCSASRKDVRCNLRTVNLGKTPRRP